MGGLESRRLHDGFTEVMIMIMSRYDRWSG
jgi:hypothetical protein